MGFYFVKSAHQNADPEVGFEFYSLVGHRTLMKNDHKILPGAILPILLIQKGQLLVTDESMCTQYWYFLMNVVVGAIVYNFVSFY